ncbi:MAG: hypothetical protein U9P14_10995, partial [Gemmatimonadota bacterium]|nr:hypothetical protein [Gemmatimonadota bacterium]
MYLQTCRSVGRAGLLGFLAALAVLGAGCDRSRARSEWLLQKYLEFEEQKNTGPAVSTLLFLRSRYGAWPAGKLAGSILATESALARSRCLRQSKNLPAQIPFLLNDQAKQTLSKCYTAGGSEKFPAVLNSIYIPRQLWQNRCLYYPPLHILGSLDQGAVLRLTDLNLMVTLLEERLGNNPVHRVISERTKRGFYIFLDSDTSGVFLDV